MGVLGRLLARTATVTPEADVPGIAAATEAVERSGRRDRALDRGEDVLAAAIAEKLLHGWLQNRHQTLFPLTVNLRTLDQERRAVLAQLAATALLAVPRDAEAGTQARRWLGGAGADADMLAAFEDARAAPTALSQVLDAVDRHHMAPYAYVVAVVMVDQHAPAGVHFLDYLGARLSLPTTVVRSANRRYRK